MSDFDAMMDDDVLHGYRDGVSPDAMPPGPNRSRSYVHGWLNGRDDRARKPRASAEAIRESGRKARLADAVDFFSTQ